MKKLLLSISVIAALILSQTANADSRHNRRDYNSYGYGNHYSSRYNPYHYGYRDRRGGSYFSLSYGNRYDYRRRGRRHSYDSGSFVGGLVLGSLLSYPRYSNRRYETVTYRSAPITRTREVVYVNRSTPASNAPVASGRRLLRDLEGNCFERVVDEEGNEVRLQLEASECNF